MAQRYIYLSEELNQRLKKEDNVSALIVNLLNKYYNDNKSEDQIIEDVKSKISEKEEAIKREQRIKEAVEKRTAEMMKQKQEITNNGFQIV